MTEYSTYGLFDLRNFEASSIDGLRSIGYHTFSAMRNLEKLTLNGIGLEFIDPQAIEFAFRLKDFDISNNPSLKSIPQQLLSHISSLNTIYMNNCSLSTLYKDYFYASYATNALIIFVAQHNKWACDGDMCPLMQWFWSSEGYFFDQIFVLGYCTTPNSLSYTRLVDAYQRGICSDNQGNNIYMYTTIILAACLLIVLTSCVCLCRRREAAAPICCCRNNDQNYEEIDDESGHPNPPDYEEAWGLFTPSISDRHLATNEDRIPPPNEA